MWTAMRESGMEQQPDSWRAPDGPKQRLQNAGGQTSKMLEVEVSTKRTSTKQEISWPS